MILIADSGSTKTDWRLIDESGHSRQFHTIGFNPFFQDTISIVTELKTSLLPGIQPFIAGKKIHIYFYGAGCSSKEKCSILFSALQHVFPHAVIEVEHDLLAAARALCGKKEGIAAIMGTGSNSCYYNGSKIVSNVSSLGYILGDEGSGAYIGKHFIQDYLNNEVPHHISEQFKASYNLSEEHILDAIYKQAMPSRFLASFSKFVSQHREEDYFKKLVRYNFDQFFTKHICKYENHRNTDLSCVGSVAFHYRDALEEVAKERNIRISKVIESPISGLASYHLPEDH
jgi:glucosamine kinase